MGCLARLGCLIVLLALAGVAFIFRDRWLPYVPARGARVEAPPTSSAWTPISPAGAQRTRDALAKLAGPRGPAYVTLDGSDVASYIFTQMAKDLPVAADSLSARVDLDQVRLRASMRTSDLGSSATGVIGLLLGERERVEMGGTLHVIGKGLAEFRVTDARIRDVSLPSAVISRLVRPLSRKDRPPGLDDNGIPISIPTYIGDVRVSNGKITLYKNVQ